MGIYSFYESKARKRKWGTWCKECDIELKSGDSLMREQLGYNEYGCMSYNEYCIKCYKKILPREMKKEIIELEKEIKVKQKILRGLKKGVIVKI